MVLSVSTPVIVTPLHRVALLQHRDNNTSNAPAKADASPPSTITALTEQTSSANKKEELQYWKAKRDRWLRSPRPRLKLIPDSITSSRVNSNAIANASSSTKLKAISAKEPEGISAKTANPSAAAP